MDLWFIDDELSSSLKLNVWIKVNNISSNLLTKSFFFYFCPCLQIEFGSEGRVWRKGDIYSYGILLMEMFTGKNPTHEMFNGDSSLKQWISNFFPNQVMEVVDVKLWTINGEAAVRDMDSLMECLASIMELALLCTRDSPQERPDMKDTVVKLKKIKAKYILEGRSVA